MEEEEEKSCCCDCPLIKIATEYEKNKDEQNVTNLETNSLITNGSKDNKLKPDNCFFKRPEVNEYSKNDLYSMQIYEIYLCIHPTVYLDKKIINWKNLFILFFI
jgi:hypothetical protein